jgi:2-phospho-L-lactate guanylyltransferase
MKKAIVIPLKDPAVAKTRLGSLFSPEERSRLVWTMFRDVAAAVSGVNAADLVALVTNHRPAMDLARSFGWGVLEEGAQTSESHSVDWASNVLKRQGVALVLRIPADIPLINPEDLELLLAAVSGERGAVAVPSRDGTGTNALARTPPDLFPSHFGPGSLALHREEAARAGARFLVIENQRLSLDVDEPADVQAVLASKTGSETQNLLREMMAARRLAGGGG